MLSRCDKFPAATFRRETKVWEDAMASGANYVVTVDGVQPARGGIPLIEQGKDPTTAQFQRRLRG